MIWLLDTDTVIFMIRGLHMRNPRNQKQEVIQAKGKRIFSRAMKQSILGDHLALSALTVAELEFGARCSDNYENAHRSLQRILLPFEPIDFDAGKSAEFYGQIRQNLEARGEQIGSLDTLIAAHAMATGATLVTNNTKEFSRVENLQLENWSAES